MGGSRVFNKRSGDIRDLPRKGVEISQRSSVGHSVSLDGLLRLAQGDEGCVV